MASGISRRGFIERTLATIPAAGLAMTTVFLSASQGCKTRAPLYEISLAERSLNRTLFAGDLDNLDFPATARNEFDEDGNERNTDYERVMRIVLDAGYRGYVGVEYEGTELSEPDGIRATKALLERTRSLLEGEYV